MIQSVRRKPGRFALVLGIVAAAACTGENLFTFPTSSNALGPTVDITVPGPGFSIALGDSILITATASAPSGAASIAYRGRYATQAAAFIAETEAVAAGETAPEIRNYLKASAGQVAGSAWVAVTLTDALGATATDSVSITITN